MEKSEIVRGLLLPAYEDAATAIQPTVTPLYDPAACTLAPLADERLGLLPARPNVGFEPELLQGRSHLIVVVTLVQAQALRLIVGRVGSPDHDTVKRSPHQFQI